MSYNFIHTIRYMGIKNKLLDDIIPEIEKITKPGDVICDLMAGTNTIGYALKTRNVIYSNDIQYYSYILAKCLLSNELIPDINETRNDLESNYNLNLKKHMYSFFVDNYTDTYFAGDQCAEIDSFRYAISKISNFYKQCFYLTALMSAMCKAQSTPGHFAQYMNKDHRRVIPLRKLSISKLFYEKINDLQRIVKSNYTNKQFNMDYKALFETEEFKNVSCVYLDSPYTSDQYSRFYHILETICKYDNPDLKFKAKYRTDRVQSDFCYKKNVSKEFEYIISFCKNNNISLVISYSNHGVITVEELLKICNKYFSNTKVKYIDYNHSSQGNGVIDIKEVLIILS